MPKIVFSSTSLTKKDHMLLHHNSHCKIHGHMKFSTPTVPWWIAAPHQPHVKCFYCTSLARITNKWWEKWRSQMKWMKQRAGTLLIKFRSNWHVLCIWLIVAFITLKYQCYCVPVIFKWLLLSVTLLIHNKIIKQQWSSNWWSRMYSKTTFFREKATTSSIIVSYYVQDYCVQHNDYYLFILTASSSHASVEWY